MPHVPVSDLVQDAVIALLAANLADLHGSSSSPVLQSIYPGRVPEGAQLPYITYGDSGESAGSNFGPSAHGDDTLTILAKGPGARGAKRIYARCVQALDRADILLAGGAMVRGRFAMITVAEDGGDPTGMTIRLVGRYSWDMVRGPTGT